jgi:hypothetical protein
MGDRVSRIRSIHPGLFTDEAFVSLSSSARLLLIGIWTEADDNGVFEWKPLTLKMRLFPVDAVDVPALLGELESVDCVRKFEHEGRQFGAVRNFGRYQFPKHPSYRHYISSDLRNYVSSRQKIDPELPESSPSPPPALPDDTRKVVDVGEERRGIGEKKKRGMAAPAADREIVFETGCIQLSRKHFDQWEASFSHLDLKAELLSLSEWASKQGKNWFHAVSAALAKRNREAKLALEKAKNPSILTPDERYYGAGQIAGVV